MKPTNQTFQEISRLFGQIEIWIPKFDEMNIQPLSDKCWVNTLWTLGQRRSQSPRSISPFFKFESIYTPSITMLVSRDPSKSLEHLTEVLIPKKKDWRKYNVSKTSFFPIFLNINQICAIFEAPRPRLEGSFLMDGRWSVVQFRWSVVHFRWSVVHFDVNFRARLD